MPEHEALADDAHPAHRLPNKLRPMPKQVRPGSFILPADVIRKLGDGHHGVGEALVGLMFDMDAPSGRVLKPEVVRDVGHGDINAGKRVLAKFVQRIRQHGEPSRYARGGAVGKVSKESVNFRQAEDNEFCARCRMFRQPSSCTAVEGRIHRVDLCDLYEQA